MKKYLEIMYTSMKISVTYRMNIIARTIGDITFIILWISVWSGLFYSKSEISGYYFQDVLIYTLSTQFLIAVTNSAMPMWRIDSSIRSGSIGSELIKPYTFFGKCLFEDLGNILVYMFLSGLPVFLITMFSLQVFPKVGIFKIFLYLLTVILGFITKYLIEYTIGLSSFWVVENRLQPLISFSISLLSGASLPLWFFPRWLKFLAEILPFKNIYFFPSSIITGKVNFSEIFRGIGSQFLWIILLIIVRNLVWKKAVKKLEIQGG